MLQLATMHACGVKFTRMTGKFLQHMHYYVHGYMYSYVNSLLGGKWISQQVYTIQN